MDTPLRILLVDDHKIVREGLRLLLGEQPSFEIVGQAFDTASGWEAVESLKPNLVIMDLNIPGEGGGVAITKRLRTEFPGIKVIVLSGHTEAAFVQAAILAGANGYVLKTDAGTELVTAIRIAMSGQTYLSPAVSTVLATQIQGQAVNPKTLSAREIEVLRRIAEGQGTKEIAFALNLSTKTIETHRLNLFAKLGVSSVAELTKHAVRMGLTQL